MQIEHSATPEFVTIQDLINDAKCFEVVRKMRWPEDVLCAHCGDQHVIKFGRDETHEGRQRYRCKSSSGALTTRLGRSWKVCRVLISLDASIGG